MKVSIVIPNYNGEEILRKNLESVHTAMNNKRNCVEEVIVVDDCSFDKSVELIKNNFPWVRLIKHKKNRGFSSSVNTGVRMSKGGLVVLLNTDVIPSENFLENVLPHFSDENVFAVSLHEKGYSWAKGIFKDGFIEHEPGKITDKPHVTFWVSGGSGVYLRKYWMKLGGMDEKLFSPFYWEDIDLCYRAAKRNLVNLWEPNALVVHKHEATISKLSKKYVTRIRERNYLLFIWKNLTSKNLLSKHILGLTKRVIRRPGYIRIVIMALLKIKPLIRKRRKERKESKVSDEAIFAKF